MEPTTPSDASQPTEAASTGLQRFETGYQTTEVAAAILTVRSSRALRLIKKSRTSNEIRLTGPAAKILVSSRVMRWNRSVLPGGYVALSTRAARL